jgi:hypothetical protein
MDPNTSNDQLDGDLINKSFSALPTTFVSGRLAGKYHFYYPEYKKENLGFGAGRRKFYHENPIMSHIK